MITKFQQVLFSKIKDTGVLFILKIPVVFERYIHDHTSKGRKQ